MGELKQIIGILGAVQDGFHSVLLLLIYRQHMGWITESGIIISDRSRHYYRLIDPRLFPSPTPPRPGPAHFILLH
jgi:hypothetical protein